MTERLNDSLTVRSATVRNTAKLLRRSARFKQGLFLAEGPQSVREALKAHIEGDSEKQALVRELFVTDYGFEHSPDEVALAREAAIPVHHVQPEVLSVVSDTETPQGLVASCHMLHREIAELVALQPRLVAVLSNIRDPGNAGTVLRAADAAGADAVIFTSGSVDIYNPKCVRSAAGSLFHVPVFIGQHYYELIPLLHDAGLTTLAADVDASHDLYDLQLQPPATGKSQEARSESNQSAASDSISLQDPTAWIFGNEAWGLEAAELAAVDHGVVIPIYGKAESLNLSVAASLCLYASATAQRRANNAVTQTVQ